MSGVTYGDNNHLVHVFSQNMTKNNQKTGGVERYWCKSLAKRRVDLSHPDNVENEVGI